MDIKATGHMISEGRKAKGLTQKQLAEQLNLSDRTISRWERGVGFPDISLLEPLSEALDIPVIDLLRGEHREDELTADAAVKETLDAVEQTRQQNRRERLRNNLKALAGLLVILAVMIQWGLIFLPVSHTIEAGVYDDGVLMETTFVKIHGRIFYSLPAPHFFRGQIQTPHAQTSVAEDYTISWRFPIRPGEATSKGTSLRSHSKYSYSTHKQDIRDGALSVRAPFVFSFFMNECAFRLSDGSVVASSPEMYDTLAQSVDIPARQTIFVPEY